MNCVLRATRFLAALGVVCFATGPSRGEDETVEGFRRRKGDWYLAELRNLGESNSILRSQRYFNGLASMQCPPQKASKPF
jgi:hypothetical protein